MAEALPLLQVSKDSQNKILALAKGILTQRQTQTELVNKMEAIDIAYARHTNQAMPQGLDATGRDVAGKEPCGDIFSSDNIIPPIVVAQVDTMVAYLADVFLSGTPIFPVVSPPNKRTMAEKLEVLLDDHANLGGYVRQLLLFLRDGVKYNVSAIEASWSAIEQFTIGDDYTSLDSNGRKVDKKLVSFTALKHLSMYNVVWDTSVSPGDVAAKGDYAGYLEIITKTKLKRSLNTLSKEKKAINVEEALNSFASVKQSTIAGTPGNFRENPTISEYVTANKKGMGTNWSVYLGESAVNRKTNSANLYDGSSFEKFTFYARVLPADLNIRAPAPNTPQIWKFVIINSSVVIQAERIISAYDLLPILFGQPMEDGFDYQTKSLAEGAMPFQEAASKLYNIRFSAARRSVSDRALYNPDLIQPKDVNSKVASAKIPVRFKALANQGFAQAYQQIPFDMRGTESALSDARVISGFSNELSGINGPQQGQFQKGNKSVQEWNDTTGNADSRLRIPAMLLECQFFTPLKQILALNIFQYGEDAKVVSQKTGEVIDVNINELRKEVLNFRITDGYNPKARIASTELLMGGMNMIMNSPILQQSFGAGLGNMFAHMMSLGGVRDLELYLPQQEAQPVAQPATQVADAAPPSMPT